MTRVLSLALPVVAFTLLGAFALVVAFTLVELRTQALLNVAPRNVVSEAFSSMTGLRRELRRHLVTASIIAALAGHRLYISSMRGVYHLLRLVLVLLHNDVVEPRMSKSVCGTDTVLWLQLKHSLE